LVAGIAAFAIVAYLVLNGSSREGPPPKDLFVGTTTLDQSGEATITLPAAVTAEDTNFGYQVATMGAPMPNLYIKSELQNDSFTVAGGTPGGEIAWQLVGVKKASLTK
jgi:hypothetical protein